MEAEPEVPRAIVAGKYRLSRLLGRGGMGSVWEGVHTTLGTRVAVKFIESEHVDSPEARHRFENEARAAATLKSKHVVEVYDHGVMDDGRPFIVMEFLEGEPLDQRLERMQRLSPKETAWILMQVCRALSKAHAAGIVHRDLKPENVFLVWDDEDGADIAKVVDFGIAKFTESRLGSSSATRTGSVLGTPYYMSPEQARGLRTVDHRSDLWSIGVIAYRCMVGRLPFEGEAVGDLLVKLCTSPIPVPSEVAPDVPPAFDGWLQKALSREVDARFQSASELAASLANACGFSTRGVLSTGEMGMIAHSLQGTPSLQAYSGQAYSPTAHSGQAYSSQAQAAALQSGQGYAPPTVPTQVSGDVTGAPITQTPAPRQAKPKTGAFVAAGFAAVVVLGIGAAVLAKVLAGGPAPGVEAGAGPALPSAPAATVEAAPPAPPSAVPAPLAVPAAGTVEARELPPPASAAPASTVPEAAKPKAVKPPPPRPARRPSKAPSAKPVEKPAPTKSGRGEIDIGY